MVSRRGGDLGRCVSGGWWTSERIRSRGESGLKATWLGERTATGNSDGEIEVGLTVVLVWCTYGYWFVYC